MYSHNAKSGTDLFKLEDVVAFKKLIEDIINNQISKDHIYTKADPHLIYHFIHMFLHRLLYKQSYASSSAEADAKYQQYKEVFKLIEQNISKFTPSFTKHHVQVITDESWGPELNDPLDYSNDQPIIYAYRLLAMDKLSTTTENKLFDFLKKYGNQQAPLDETKIPTSYTRHLIVNFSNTTLAVTDLYNGVIATEKLRDISKLKQAVDESRQARIRDMYDIYVRLKNILMQLDYIDLSSGQHTAIPLLINTFQFELLHKQLQDPRNTPSAINDCLSCKDVPDLFYLIMNSISIINPFKVTNELEYAKLIFKILSKYTAVDLTCDQPKVDEETCLLQQLNNSSTADLLLDILTNPTNMRFSRTMTMKLLRSFIMQCKMHNNNFREFALRLIDLYLDDMIISGALNDSGNLQLEELDFSPLDLQIQNNDVKRKINTTGVFLYLTTSAAAQESPGGINCWKLFENILDKMYLADKLKSNNLNQKVTLIQNNKPSTENGQTNLFDVLVNNKQLGLLHKSIKHHLKYFASTTEEQQKYIEDLLLYLINHTKTYDKEALALLFNFYTTPSIHFLENVSFEIIFDLIKNKSDNGFSLNLHHLLNLPIEFYTKIIKGLQENEKFKLLDEKLTASHLTAITNPLQPIPAKDFNTKDSFGMLPIHYALQVILQQSLFEKPSEQLIAYINNNSHQLLKDGKWKKYHDLLIQFMIYHKLEPGLMYAFEENALQLNSEFSLHEPSAKTQRESKNAIALKPARISVEEYFIKIHTRDALDTLAIKTFFKTILNLDCDILNKNNNQIQLVLTSASSAYDQSIRIITSYLAVCENANKGKKAKKLSGQFFVSKKTTNKNEKNEQQLILEFTASQFKALQNKENQNSISKYYATVKVTDKTDNKNKSNIIVGESTSKTPIDLTDKKTLNVWQQSLLNAFGNAEGLTIETSKKEIDNKPYTGFLITLPITTTWNIKTKKGNVNTNTDNEFVETQILSRLHVNGIMIKLTTPENAPYPQIFFIPYKGTLPQNLQTQLYDALVPISENTNNNNNTKLITSTSTTTTTTTSTSTTTTTPTPSKTHSEISTSSPREALQALIQKISGLSINLNNIYALNKDKGIKIDYQPEGMKTLNLANENIETLLVFKTLVYAINYACQHSIPTDEKDIDKLHEDLNLWLSDECQPNINKDINVYIEINPNNVAIIFKTTVLNNLLQIMSLDDLSTIFKLAQIALLDYHNDQQNHSNLPKIENIRNDYHYNLFIEPIKLLACAYTSAPRTNHKFLATNVILYLNTLTSCPAPVKYSINELTHFYTYAIHSMRLFHTLRCVIADANYRSAISALRNTARHGVYEYKKHADKYYTCSIELFTCLKEIFQFYTEKTNINASIPDALFARLEKAYERFIQAISSETFAFSTKMQNHWGKDSNLIQNATEIDKNKRAYALYCLASFSGQYLPLTSYQRQVYQFAGHHSLALPFDQECQQLLNDLHNANNNNAQQQMRTFTQANANINNNNNNSNSNNAYTRPKRK